MKYPTVDLRQNCSQVPSGPGRVKQQEIRDTFRDGWSVTSIRPAVFESRTRAEGPHAWLSSVTKK